MVSDQQLAVLIMKPDCIVSRRNGNPVFGRTIGDLKLCAADRIGRPVGFVETIGVSENDLTFAVIDPAIDPTALRQ